MKTAPIYGPIRRLTCCCCGSSTIGRQWWNRDTGFGLCSRCHGINGVANVPVGSPDPAESPSFGTRGIHWDLPRNARLWTFHRLGWVKITLRPGQALTARTFSRHDEGHSWSAETWTHRGDHVFCQWGDGGRDCDGPISHYGEGTCALADLLAVDAYLDKAEGKWAVGFYHRTKIAGAHLDGVRIRRPEWTLGESETRDAHAEAAGY